MDDVTGARILITGGAGFVGSNLARAVSQRGAEVRVLDNLTTGHPRNLAGLEAELVEGDVRDVEAVAAAVEGIDFVLHHAAVASVPESNRDPLGSSAVNITGTLNVLEASAAAGVKRLVFASSASVYGQGESWPIAEDHALLPCSPYAASKAAGEALCHAWSASRGLETVCLRYFNIFGPMQDPRSYYAGVIPVFIDSLRRSQPVVVFGDGQQTRDFVFVEDVVQANLKACLSPGISGRAVNVGRGVPTSIEELARWLATLMGAELNLIHEPIRPGDVRDSCADISLARELLGYEPTTSMEAGLTQTLRWFDSREAGPRAH